MTDTTFYKLQSDSTQIMLDELFKPVYKLMDEKHLALGKINAKLQDTTQTYFMHQGVIYPCYAASQLPYGTFLPLLHYSLISDLEGINKIPAQVGYHEIKSYFNAVITKSAHEIVLEYMVPSVVIEGLKTAITKTEFKALDMGTWDGIQRQSLSDTQQAIENLKSHYKETITLVKHLLMDKLLFNS